MEILKQSRNFEKKELFKITNDNHLLLKNLPDDTIVNVVDYVSYKTDDNKVIAVMWHVNEETGETVSIATSSPSVIRIIESASDFLETYNLQYKLTRGKSKAGRTYMNFELV